MNFKQKLFLGIMLCAPAVYAGVTIRITPPTCLPSNVGVAQATSVVDLISNDLSIFEQVTFSQIEALSGIDFICSSTAVSAGTTISVAGIYCLSVDVTGLITINASNVTLDLNGHTVTGGIAVSPGRTNVVMYNGTIKNGSSGNGIYLQSGCSAIELNSIEIVGATYGIKAENVAHSTIKHCIVRENTYGVYCSSCYGITIEDTKALSNSSIGFDLLTSSSNVLMECQALSTGRGSNMVSTNTVVGFVATNGYGNIFERCIANGTQALLTTDVDSLIAGFVLQGTEGCTKTFHQGSSLIQLIRD